MRVCIVSEGGYPIVRGGLSEWAHMLIKTLNDVEFDVFCTTGSGKERPTYSKLKNVKSRVIVPLIGARSKRKSSLPRNVTRTLSDSLQNVLLGAPLDLESIVKIRKRYNIDKGWLLSESYWHFLSHFYRKNYPDHSFVEFFWTVFGLYSVLLESISAMLQIPHADVYHCLSSGYAGLAGSLAKITHHRPLIVTEQGLYLVEREKDLSRQNVSEWYRKQVNKFSESIVKTSYRYADYVVPPCHSHIEVEEKLGMNPSRIRLIDNGIDCNKFIPGPTRNGVKPVVGCFARVVPIKGIEVLIKAAKIVTEKYPADFVVVGEIQDKQYHGECQKLVEELGLKDRFRFIGYTESLQWYHKIDVFTLSSISEGVPYALLEAMSCGLPAVCTAVGGVPEIVRKDTGYLVPPNDPNKLAEKLGELVTNRELRLTMGKRATQVAKEKYTIQDMANNFYKLYEELSNVYKRK